MLLQDYFDNPQTFLIVKSAHPAKDPLLPNATYVMSFANYQQLRMRSFRVDSPLHQVVLYDDEKWPSTPVAQQQRRSPTRRRQRLWRTNTAWD